MDDSQLENPILGYVVIAVALVVGTLSATVLGHLPDRFSCVPANCVVDRQAHCATLCAAECSDVPTEQSSRAETTGPPRRWVLGVAVHPTSAGCLVSRVVPGSGAERVGLAVGDRIVTIGGRQVGWVGTRLAPLHKAVDQCGQATTWLVVQRHSTGRVSSMSVRLQTPEESLGH